jgi:hypothetical protein
VATCGHADTNPDVPRVPHRTTSEADASGAQIQRSKPITRAGMKQLAQSCLSSNNSTVSEHPHTLDEIHY